VNYRRVKPLLRPIQLFFIVVGCFNTTGLVELGAWPLAVLALVLSALGIGLCELMLYGIAALRRLDAELDRMNLDETGS
jgi:hypothetical protein